jgi:BlaI family transcriptional regulator, penicillinase repressor
MMQKQPEIGPLEIEVLGTLNATSDQGVSDIQSALKSAGKNLAYTTVMTVLVRLHKKGLVSRRKEGRQFLYTVSEKKSASPSGIFSRFKKSLFGAERLQPILALLDGESELTHEELKELRKQVDARLQSTESKKE